MLWSETVINGIQEPAGKLFPLFPQNRLPLVHTDSQNMAQCNPTINYVWQQWVPPS